MLPEYHLTNWLPKDPSFAGLCDQWEAYLKKYQDLAKECGICIVPGTIVEGHRGEEKEEDRLLNVAYFIGKDGKTVGKYVKKNLWYVASMHSIDKISIDMPYGASQVTNCSVVANTPQGSRARPPYLIHLSPTRSLRHSRR